MHEVAPERKRAPLRGLLTLVGGGAHEHDRHLVRGVRQHALQAADGSCGLVADRDTDDLPTAGRAGDLLAIHAAIMAPERC